MGWQMIEWNTYQSSIPNTQCIHHKEYVSLGTHWHASAPNLSVRDVHPKVDVPKTSAANLPNQPIFSPHLELHLRPTATRHRRSTATVQITKTLSDGTTLGSLCPCGSCKLAQSRATTSASKGRLVQQVSTLSRAVYKFRQRVPTLFKTVCMTFDPLAAFLDSAPIYLPRSRSLKVQWGSSDITNYFYETTNMSGNQAIALASPEKTTFTMKGVACLSRDHCARSISYPGDNGVGQGGSAVVRVSWSVPWSLLSHWGDGAAMFHRRSSCWNHDCW